MIRKFLFIITFTLNQIADRLLDFLWIYFLYSKTKDLSYLVIFLVILFVGRYIIFNIIKYIFAKTNFYNDYIYAFSFGFLMILIVNREGFENSILYLVAIKEIFSAFRIIGTKSYLNDLAYNKEAFTKIINAISYLSFPLAILILNYYIQSRIVDQIYTGIALLIGPSMILFYNLFNTNHHVLAGQPVNLKLKLQTPAGIVRMLFRYLAVLAMPMMALGYYLMFVSNWYGGVFGGLMFQIIILVVLSVVTLLIHLLDGLKVLSNKYNEFDNKLLETIVMLLGVVIICLIGIP